MTTDATQLPTGPGTSLESVKTSIREKAKDSTLTEQELAELRNEICQLSPEAMKQLQKFIDEEYKGILVATRMKLDTLLKECTSPISLNTSSPETSESKDGFDRIFEGTKSEMLSKEKVAFIKNYILAIYTKELPDLSPSQKDNLLVATIDRLLVNPDFTKIVDKLTGGLVSVVKDFEKEGIGGLFSSSDEEKPKPEEGVDQTKVSLTEMDKRIMDIINTATDPLVKLLKTKPVGMDGFLSDPRSIARYDGSGKIDPNIAPMNEISKANYLKDLNNRVLKIDGKIIPLENMRERGMDMVAKGPGWLQEIFKWLLELPFIGNILASFLGYKDGAEALGSVDEELRQRKSVTVLREFSQVPDMSEGKKAGDKKPGKYHGDIKILEWADLSGVSHKKLKEFFQFGKEMNISPVTRETWISLFEKGEIVAKDTEGKEVKYSLEKPIDAKDLEKDFAGLYQKLNGLAAIKKNKEYAAVREQEKQQKQGEVEGVTPQASEADKALDNGKSAIPVTAASMASQWPTVARAMAESEAAKPEETVPAKPQVTQESALTEALLDVTSFPLSFEYDNKQETVSFANERLHVGDKVFSLAVHWNGTPDFVSLPVRGLAFNGGEIIASYMGGKTSIPRNQITEWIAPMLALAKDGTKEITDPKWKLIITRIA